MPGPVYLLVITQRLLSIADEVCSFNLKDRRPKDEL